MKTIYISPTYEAEILRVAAKKLLKIAIQVELQGDILQAMFLRRRAKEFEQQANLRTN